MAEPDATGTHPAPTRRPTRLARATLLAIAVVLGATIGATLVTRDAVERAEHRVLEDRVRDLSSITRQITAQLATSLQDAALAAELAGDDRARFEQLVRERLSTGPLATIALLEPAGDPHAPIAAVGDPPMVLAGLAAEDIRRASAGAADVPTILSITPDGSSFVLTYGVPVPGGRLVYAELRAGDVARDYFASAEGIEGAIYVDTPLGRQFLAANTPDVPIEGATVERTFPLIAGFDGVVVAAARGRLLDRRVAMAPWLVLGFGLVLLVVVALLVEQTQRRRDRALALVEELNTRATHDELTGLGNRRLLDERAAALLAAGGSASLVLVDLDDFKLVNDVRGHGAGDQVLRAVAGRLAHEARAGDLCARLGGDEFAVLVAADGDVAETIARRILAGLAAPITVQGEDLRVRASIGVATAGAGATAETLLRDADLAMYATKGSETGARLRRFDGSLLAEATRRHRLALDLRGAAQRGELELRYQPDIPLGDGAIQTAEALLRWRHPVHGLLLPGSFLADAERSGEIVALGEWVQQEAVRAVIRLRALEPELRIAINASRRELLAAGFVERLTRTIAAAGLPADAIALEIAEQAFVDAAVVPVIAEVLGHGVPVALDDFGAAHSSLHVVGTLGIQGIKIDRALMPRVPTDADRRFLKALAEMLHARGQFVIAEGVETAAAQDAARDAGFDAMQGYAIAQPLTEPELTAYLAARRVPVESDG